MANFSQILFFWVLFFLPRQVLAEPVSTQEAITTLNQAVQFYQMSDRTEAMQRFLSISMNESYPASVRQEARIYMAEILLLEGNEDGAKKFIREILLANPKYQIDRFRHPPEICSLFDEIKESSPKPIEKNTTPIRPTPPASIFLPFGVHQLREKKWIKGVACSTSQALLAGGSLGMRSYLQTNQNPKAPTEDEATLNAILIGQYSATTLFYISWFGCSFDAYRTWKKEVTPPPEN